MNVQLHMYKCTFTPTVYVNDSTLTESVFFSYFINVHPM